MGPERPNSRSWNCWLRFARRITQSCWKKTERSRTFTVDGRSFLAYSSNNWKVSLLLKHRTRDWTNNRAANLVIHQRLGSLMRSTFRWVCSDRTCVHYFCLPYKKLGLEVCQIVRFSLGIRWLCPACQERILANPLHATLSFGVIACITCNM